MSDYISREAALEAFENADADVMEDYGDGTSDWGFGRENIRETLNSVPTADVEPVRHVPRKVWGIDEYYGEWLRCPNCGYEDNTVNAKYCGGCGSKMDLEVENDG